MCGKLIYLISFVLVIGLAAGNQAAAETIYYDNFDGSAGVDLNGTTPDISLTGASWVAGSNDFDADGTVTWDGAGQGDSAYLPFVPASGYVYTLSATIQAVSAVTDTNWIALGFTQSNASPDSRFYGDNGSRNPIYWALSRTNQATLYDQDFNGPDTAGGSDFTTISADNLKIVLDTSATTWTASWYFNDSLHRTVNVADGQKPNFQYVAISNNKTGGSIDDFLLTQELGPRAANPSPAEEVMGVPRDVNLSWTPGLYADKHDVYFGTSFNDVNNATRGSPLGVLVSENQDPNSYDPGLLAFGTKYYWRIDEVNDPNIWKGNVWNFTTEVGTGIIFYENFDGPAGALNGTTPDITTGAATWVAGSDIDADGTITWDDVWSGATGYLPFVPEDGYIYELSADLNAIPARVGGEGDWIGLGFTQSNGEPNSRFYDDNGSRNPVYWGMSRTNQASQNDQTFIGTGPGTGEGATFGGATCSTISADDIKIVLNTVEPNWVVSWYYNGNLERTVVVSESRKSYFNYVAITTNKIDGTVDEFLLTGELQLQAWKPNPDDDELIYTTDVTLQWRPGAYADQHDVYFADNWNDVNSADSDDPMGPDEVYKARQDANSYDPGPLAFGTTYYWRIDEVNDPNIWRGEIWSFKVQPLTAYNPSPPNEANYVDPDANLGWSPGANAEFHDVYLGTDFSDVNNATRSIPLGVLVSENQGPNTYDPGTLVLGATYYWRIDEVNSPSIWKGDVWNFTTEPNIPITDPNLIGYWTFDEGVGTKALDWSGHGKDGTLVNGTLWVAGHPDKNGGVRFDGLDDYVDLPIGEDINSLTSCTFMTWVDFDNIGGNDQHIFDFGTGTTVYMYLSPRTGGAGPLTFAITTTGTETQISDTDTLESGWHHVAVVINGVSMQMQLYLDADVVDSDSTTILPEDLGVTTNNWLGRNQFGGNTWFTGVLDDFRIYDYALTAEEIEDKVAFLWAWKPRPADGATDVRGVPPPTLTWKAGKYAASVAGHRVYFDPNEQKVIDRSGCEVNGVSTDDPCYPIGSPLELGWTYYWAVDEVNGPNTWEGDVWSFTTGGYLVVEDFDSYVGHDALGTIWKDYWTNGTSAEVYVQRGAADANLVRDGNSMRYWYGNGQPPYYSEAEANTTGPNSLPSQIGSDWTASDVKALVLYFYGQSGNDANEQMYVALSDGSKEGMVIYGDYGEDPNDLRVEEWQEWNIDLEDFNSAGVDLTNVTRITIGFGDGSKGGSGTVYFDDIQLHRPRCVPSRVKPAGDIDNDCYVDYNDLEALTNNWLISDYNVIPQDPGTTGLVARYEFEGDFNDSSGNGNHGDPCGGVSIISSGDPCRGQVASFDGDANGYVELPIGDDINLMTNSTFMTWVDFNSASAGAWQRIFDFGPVPDLNSDPNVYMFLTPRIGTDGVMRFAITTNGPGAEDMADAPDTLASGWHHVAVTIDADNDIISLYLDGELVGENTDATLTPSDLGVTVNNWLGRSQWVADAYFMGSLDDFRIYNRALSQGEVAWIYGLRDEFTQPLYLLLTPANPEINLYVDGTIDFKDYVVMANWWLEEKLWP